MTADAHNPDACLAARPYQFSTAAAFVHKLLETRALDAGTHDLRVLATMFVILHCSVPQFPALQHYVEMLGGVPLVQLFLDITFGHVFESSPHPH